MCLVGFLGLALISLFYWLFSLPIFFLKASARVIPDVSLWMLNSSLTGLQIGSSEEMAVWDEGLGEGEAEGVFLFLWSGSIYLAWLGYSLLKLVDWNSSSLMGTAGTSFINEDVLFYRETSAFLSSWGIISIVCFSCVDEELLRGRVIFDSADSSRVFIDRWLLFRGDLIVGCRDLDLLCRSLLSCYRIRIFIYFSISSLLRDSTGDRRILFITIGCWCCWAWGWDGGWEAPAWSGGWTIGWLLSCSSIVSNLPTSYRVIGSSLSLPLSPTLRSKWVC